jgi:hypothetical protein
MRGHIFHHDCEKRICERNSNILVGSFIYTEESIVGTTGTELGNLNAMGITGPQDGHKAKW